MPGGATHGGGDRVHGVAHGDAPRPESPALVLRTESSFQQGRFFVSLFVPLYFYGLPSLLLLKGRGVVPIARHAPLTRGPFCLSLALPLSRFIFLVSLFFS